MHIFIVDDDPAALNSLRFLLESEGYTVFAFKSGPDFLAQLPRANADFIILDYKMSEMNGLEVYRTLRQVNPDVPVVLVTGHPDPGIRVNAQRAGLELIEKPLSQETILRAVRRAQADRQDSH
jgi:FixJ family two-component response regulator